MSFKLHWIVWSDGSTSMDTNWVLDSLTNPWISVDDRVDSVSWYDLPSFLFHLFLLLFLAPPLLHPPVMVQPPFPFSAHPWPPPTPSASTLLHLPPLHSDSESYLCNLCKLCHAHSCTNCRSIPELFVPGFHAKGHHLYTLSTFILFA